MTLAGGKAAPISIIPAAAAPDNKQDRAGNNGVTWFRNLGALRVTTVPLIDKPSADDPAIADVLRHSSLIFLLGGFPGYLAQTLINSLNWKAISETERAGGVIAGSSADAMVLCEHFYDPFQNRVTGGLNMVHGACVIPHHDTTGRKWASKLRELLPDTMLIGIDEETGMISDSLDGFWHVYGKGQITLYRENHVERFAQNREFRLP